MTPKLTEADCAFLSAAEDRYCYRGEAIGPIGIIDIYSAGWFAGIERAAAEFDRRKALADVDKHEDTLDEAGEWIAAIIRSLVQKTP